MKKIEKTFYVNDEKLKQIKGDALEACGCAFGNNKITISWEEPEKTVTISESEWDCIAYLYADDMKMAKQKLFGERND